MQTVTKYSDINCTQKNNKLHEDGQKLKPKDVGGINEHNATSWC